MSELLDLLSEFLAHRKGLLPLLGILLIVGNLVMQFIFPADFLLVRTNLLLHVGLIVAIFGLMLSWAL